MPRTIQGGMHAFKSIHQEVTPPLNKKTSVYLNKTHITVKNQK